MENFATFFVNEVIFLTKSAGEWFYLFSAFWSAILIAMLICGIFFKKFRYLKKDVTISVTAFLTCIWTACIFLLEKSSSPYTFACLTGFGLDFILCEVLKLQSNAKVKLSAKEKRLIGRLSAKSFVGDYEGGRLKRVEFLNEKNSPCGDVEPNFNEIKRIIDKLRREELSLSEEDELDKTEMDMEKFSARSPAPFERKILSERLMKIVKMMSKYHIS